MSSVILIFNICFWIGTIIWYKKSFPYIGVGGVLLLLYLLFAVFSWLIFIDPYWGSRYKELAFFPFVYLNAMMMVCLIPIFKWDKSKISRIVVNDEKVLKIICWVFIVSSIIRITYMGSPTRILDGLVTMVVSQDAGHDIYLDTMQKSHDVSGVGIIKNIFAIVSNFLYDICVLILFYLLSKRTKNKLILVGLIISILICVVIPISESQRGPAVERMLLVVLVFFLFKKHIGEYAKKVFSYICLGLGGIISIPLAYITFSRFADRGVWGSVFSYFGQHNLLFNNYAFDNNGLRYGDRVFPVFKQLLGFDNVPLDFWTRRDKYPQLYINDECFIGYVGDFLLDFGPIISVLILCGLTWLVYSQIKVSHGQIQLYRMVPLLFLVHMCGYGSLFLFPFADMRNYEIVAYILLFYVLKNVKLK